MTILKDRQRSLNNANIESGSCRVLLERPVLEGPTVQHVVSQITDLDNPDPQLRNHS